ncbi:MAG: AI-2E family transporter [Alphaproteobacteria bacterium]|nr:AI-2E family transporter [Alphaproteobacteria bacterium]
MSTPQKAVFWLIGLAVAVALIYVLRPVLLPFVAAMAVAYFMDPLCDWIETHGLSRGMATGLVTLGFFVCVILFFSFVGPLLFGQIAEFIERVPGYAEILQRKAGPLVALAVEQFDAEHASDISRAATQHIGTALRLGARAVGELLGGLGAVVNILSLIVLTPIVSFYLLRDWDVIVAKVDSWLPRAEADTIRELVRETDEILAGFVRGQATVCALLGLFYGVALTLAGLDFGFIVGLFTGLASFIPYFGMLIGMTVGFGVAFAQFDTLQPFLIIGAIFIAGQILEGNFLTPRLVGGRVKLHEIWIIFALLAGGSLFGFLGILLALPVAAVMGVLVRFGLARYLASAFYDHGVIVARPSDAAEASKPEKAENGDADPGKKA